MWLKTKDLDLCVRNKGYRVTENGGIYRIFKVWSLKSRTVLNKKYLNNQFGKGIISA